MLADEARVENVTIAVPPLAPTVTGLVLPNEQFACPGVNVTVDVTLHARVTVPVYPFAELTVTVACDEPPGLIDAGLAVPAESE
jgi:hypothetical protein